MYNPLLNKKPYGASVQNQETRITFPVDNSLQIKRVFVVLRQVFGEGGEVAGDCLRYELPYSHSDETQDFLSERFRFPSGAFGIIALRASSQTVTLRFSEEGLTALP